MSGSTAMSVTTTSGTAKLSGSFCDKVKQITAQNYIGSLFAGTQSTDPAARLKAFKSGFAAMSDTMHALAADVPAALKPDIDYYVKVVDQANAQVQKMTTFDPTALENATKPFNTAEFQKHENNLKEYSQKTCGVASN